MMSAIRTIRNIMGGMLVGWGFVSFFCFLIMNSIWVKSAPSYPNQALGLVYKHNEHGSNTYFSQFQTTASGLILPMSIPMVFLGMLVVPKNKPIGPEGWYAATFKRQNGFPDLLANRVTIGSAISTPLVFYFVGPYIVRTLIAWGLTIDL